LNTNPTFIRFTPNETYTITLRYRISRHPVALGSGSLRRRETDRGTFCRPLRSRALQGLPVRRR
jgi:hypothetical protein